ncbi:MAG: undecaprenyl-diphosphate phosphatase [Victivallales bacterium]|nr:undecaprenyl-diphosphate phosphatase [Victivallales bacterium]
METLKIIVMALVQGITEFLPVSSSGHLAIIGHLLNIGKSTAILSVALHAGSLLSILAFYYKRLVSLCMPGSYRILALAALATIPAAIAGSAVKYFDFLDILFSNLFFPGFGLILTSAIIFFGIRERPVSHGLDKMTARTAWLTGLAQAVSLIPGVSRSGSTIAAALRLGIKREDAAFFSFLMAIPAIAGVSFFEILNYFLAKPVPDPDSPVATLSELQIAAGIAVSAITGYFALRILENTLKKGRMNMLAAYCLAMGIFAIALKIVSMTFKI